VLAEAIFREGLKLRRPPAPTPMPLVRGIRKAVEPRSPRRCRAMAKLDQRRPTAASRRSRRSARTTTATIGKIMAEAFEKVGKDGVITVEEGKSARDHASTSSRACSSTAATSRPTS
jgi:chaperonin GroEL